MTFDCIWRYAVLFNFFYIYIGFPGDSVVKNPPANAGEVNLIPESSQEDPLEKEMATHSSILAWEISWTEEPADYSPWGGRESETNVHTLSTLQFVFQDNSSVCFSHLISSFWPTLTPGHFDQLWLIDQVLVLLNLCFPVASLNKSVGISQRVELRSECLVVFTRKQTWLYQKHICIKVLPSPEPLGQLREWWEREKKKNKPGLDPETQSGNHDDDKGWDKWVLTSNLVEEGLPS